MTRTIHSKPMKKLIFSCVLFALSISLHAQKATVKEVYMSFPTYMFSDPNPIPNTGRIYPYFRFDGYTASSSTKDWKMIVLENDYIKVFIAPEIGGKIWGAIEKSSGGEFLYFNDAVKFRDVAMRGPWTSGGLEYNFGAIGHIPTGATPVDYQIKENSDGSVSCTVGAIDLPARTKWNVEIMLPPDKAWVKTTARWVNSSGLNTSYYHWMNAAAKAHGNLEFLIPGKYHIGHGGVSNDWPVDKGREISWYEKNNFGFYKSYHVINEYAKHYGGYWHDDDFGFGHYAEFYDKPGKKIWIWGLSGQGMIWEDLLTDSKGQYIEYQAGKLFNQAAFSSSKTPFKHKEFLPYDSDVMEEYWFPLMNTGGMRSANPNLVFNIIEKNDSLELIFSALAPLDEELTIHYAGNEIQTSIHCKPLEQFRYAIPKIDPSQLEVLVSNETFHFSGKRNYLDRPVKSYDKVDENSVYAIYTAALEAEKQRLYDKAFPLYEKCLEKDPGFLPAISRLALHHHRILDYEKALNYTLQALSIDTYHPLANYLFGLINEKDGNDAEAMAAYSVCSADPSMRSAAFTRMAILSLKNNRPSEAFNYSQKALVFNAFNSTALEVEYLCLDQMNKKTEAEKTLQSLAAMDPISEFVKAENYFKQKIDQRAFLSSFQNELPDQSLLELAIKYCNYGQTKKAIDILKTNPDHILFNIWLAFLDRDHKKMYLDKAKSQKLDFVFPYRPETYRALNNISIKENFWKADYLKSLILLNAGRINEAKELLVSCNRQSDYFVSYLLEAELKTKQEDRMPLLKKAIERAPDSWRANYAMAEQLLELKQYSEAEKLLKVLGKEHPESTGIGLLYAKSLLLQKKYASCIQFLEQFYILPYEGSTDGKIIFEKACLFKSLKEYQQKKYKKAAKTAEKSLLWPVNLGSGKPYDTDDRLNGYLLAQIAEKDGSEKLAKMYYEKIAAFDETRFAQEGSALYFQLKALEQTGEKEKALELAHKLTAKYPDNLYIQWAIQKFNAADTHQVLEEIRKKQSEIMPYDNSYVDSRFSLIIEILKILEAE